RVRGIPPGRPPLPHRAAARPVARHRAARAAQHADRALTLKARYAMQSVRLLLVALLLAGSALPATSQAPAPRPTPSQVARGTVPPPVFTDPERVAKLRQALPEIERLFDAWVERQRFPG